MADQIIQVPPNSTGLKVDCSELTVGANTVERQRIVLADPATAEAFAGVQDTATVGTEYGIVVRESQRSSVYHAVAAASTNAASVKATAGQVYAWHIFNNAAYPVYVKLFNLAAAPTVGTSVPTQTIGVQAGTAVNGVSPVGVYYNTGIAIAITKGIADTDATAVLADDCVVDLEYS